MTTVVTNNNAYDMVSPQLTATNSFTVIVREVNRRRCWRELPPQTVNELTPLTVTNTAGEPNIHSADGGLRAGQSARRDEHQRSGVITWTPREAQSPGTNTVTTVVTNNNAYDMVNPQLTATNSFTVIVREVNPAPVLGVLRRRRSTN